MEFRTVLRRVGCGVVWCGVGVVWVYREMDTKHGEEAVVFGLDQVQTVTRARIRDKHTRRKNVQIDPKMTAIETTTVSKHNTFVLNMVCKRLLHLGSDWYVIGIARGYNKNIYTLAIGGNDFVSPNTENKNFEVIN